MTDILHTKALTVLVADDTSANRNMMTVFLRKLGLASICVADGREAVDAYVEQRPDIVLMDLMMPEMDGFEATRRIRAAQRGEWTPILIMSALNADADIVAGLDAGADDYMVKPISFTVFAAKMRTMQRLLAMERGQRELLGRVQAISNAVIDGIVTVDETGLIQSANPAAHRMFGYEAGSLIGQNVSVLTPPGIRSEHDGYLARYLAGGPKAVIGTVREVQGARAGGEIFPLELGVTELKFEDRRLFIGVLRDISERVRVREEREQHAAHLQHYHDEQQREQLLARQIMASQVNTEAMNDPRIHYSVMPAQNFSGDMVVAATSPGGRLYAMLADATGHGLSAAVSVQPVLPLFYALVAQDTPLAGVVSQINHMLHETLPVGRFVGAAMMSLSADGCAADVWVGGVPAVLVVTADGRIRARVPSQQLPLGVVESCREGCAPEQVVLAPGEQIVLHSDGVTEAANDAGEDFGLARLEAVIAAWPARQRVDMAKIALAEHLAGASAHDDMSLLMIDAKAADSAGERADPSI
ncbi:SpoIIE family protein phosphatase [Nitrogeniibacter mangrovi]|uniref:Sensor protein FixL n=1 Tax=Nitrogeniibacter mangrovi TaxID=2016596 RepID=A0A6C1B9S5_9RHOO|nr:SpoIIE family protein phosphatase [Nitrogeniibacter mangrovi]QID19014.1 SpoIIE family protein phosphatase [Nitrogeniibacter mangrovi]